MILEAYRRGVVLCGLSAGGICWFEKMYSDTDIIRYGSQNYSIYVGMGMIEGACLPAL